MSTCKLLRDEEDATLSSNEYYHIEYDADVSQCSSVRSLLREELETECITTSKYCSASIGFIVGVFIQGSTLGLNWMIAEVGKSHGSTKIPPLNTYIALTVGWTVIASTLATAVLFLLRSLVVSTFYSTNNVDCEELRQKEKFMLQVIQTMERITAVGAVFGVGMARCLSDILLGVQSRVLHSSVTIVVAALWYCTRSR